MARRLKARSSIELALGQSMTPKTAAVAIGCQCRTHNSSAAIVRPPLIILMPLQMNCGRSFPVGPGLNRSFQSENHSSAVAREMAARDW